MSKKKKTSPLSIAFANEQIHRMQFGLTFKLTLADHYYDCKLPKTKNCSNKDFGKILKDYYEGFNDHGKKEINAYGEEILKAIRIIAYREYKNKNEGGLKFNIQALKNPKYNIVKRKKWLKKTYQTIKKYSPNSFITKEDFELISLKIFASSISSCYLTEIENNFKNIPTSLYIEYQESNFITKHPEK